jgi:hypothetical protein
MDILVLVSLDIWDMMDVSVSEIQEETRIQWWQNNVPLDMAYRVNHMFRQTYETVNNDKRRMFENWFNDGGWRMVTRRWLWDRAIIV